MRYAHVRNVEADPQKAATSISSDGFSARIWAPISDVVVISTTIAI